MLEMIDLDLDTGMWERSKSKTTFLKSENLADGNDRRHHYLLEVYDQSIWSRERRW